MTLCRGDLSEILGKISSLGQSQQGEDKLRKEIIDQGKKMNELRGEHERQMYEISHAAGLKEDQLQ